MRWRSGSWRTSIARRISRRRSRCGRSASRAITCRSSSRRTRTSRNGWWTGRSPTRERSIALPSSSSIRTRAPWTRRDKPRTKRRRRPRRVRISTRERSRRWRRKARRRTEMRSREGSAQRTRRGTCCKAGDDSLID